MADEIREQPKIPPQEREAAPEAAEVSVTPEIIIPVPEAAPAQPEPTPVVMSPLPPMLMAKDEYQMRIERALEDGLVDVYVTLPPAVRADFKRIGEQTAVKIRALIGSAKVRFSEIVALIRTWLRIIPSVNRFYLEQEAKIKTDKVLLIAEQLKTDGTV